MKKTLMLVDTSALIYRAFFALPELTNSKGEPTNAIYGFFLMLQKVMSDFQPTDLVMALDVPKPTFRKKLFPKYRAQRPKMKDELRVQIPKILQLLKKSKIECIGKEGYEADDVIGTLSTQLKDEYERIILLTSDRDLLQLVTEKAFLISPLRGVSKFDLYTPQKVREKFGVTPEQFADYKALVGDASDNYADIKGIGPKTAQSLIVQFGTIENLIENIQDIKSSRIKNILENHIDTLKLYKTLAYIVRDLEIESLDPEHFRFEGFDEEMISEARKLQLNSLLPKLQSVNRKLQQREEEEKQTEDQINLF